MSQLTEVQTNCEGNQHKALQHLLSAANLSAQAQRSMPLVDHHPTCTMYVPHQ